MEAVVEAVVEEVAEVVAVAVVVVVEAVQVEHQQAPVLPHPQAVMG